jgi:hypothetical protein
MATELEVKARERRELLDEIRKRRAAAAQAEGSLGAAERGDYGEVGQGEKGPFDDEVNQDPGNPLENLMEYQAGDVSQLDLTKAQRGVLPKSPIDDAIRRGLGIFFRKSPIGLMLTYGPEIAQSVKNFMMPVRQADTGTGIMMPMSENISDIAPRSQASNQVIYNPQKSFDDLVDNKPQKSIKISSKITDPDVSKLEVIGKDGNTYVLVGDRLVPKENAVLKGYAIKETDRAEPRVSYNYVLKNREDLIREKSGTGTVMIGGREVPYENTILVTGTDGRTYRVMTKDAYKPFEGSGKPKDVALFKTFVAENKVINDIVSDKTLNADKNSIFRYLDFIRKSSTSSAKPVDGKFNNFFEDFKLEINDLKNTDSAFYKQYQYFKEYDKIRDTVSKKVKPILDKIFPAKKEGREASNSVQIAHRFMNTQIGKTVPEGLAGTGGTPSAYYLDISRFNSEIQGGLESQARKAIKEGNTKAIKEVDKKLKDIGAEINIDGVKLGEHKFIEEKLNDLIMPYINSPKLAKEAGITPKMIKDYNEALEILNQGAQSIGKKYNLTVPALAKGGIVGINKMTSSLSARY